MYVRRLKRFCVKLFIAGCVYRGGGACTCWDIALWVRRPTLSLLEAEKSVDKGLRVAYFSILYSWQWPNERFSVQNHTHLFVQLTGKHSFCCSFSFTFVWSNQLLTSLQNSPNPRIRTMGSSSKKKGPATKCPPTTSATNCIDRERHGQTHNGFFCYI